MRGTHPAPTGYTPAHMFACIQPIPYLCAPVRVSGRHNTISMSNQEAIEKRRTFGIISHPDAGKTTLTEKLLLFGGAIQSAGAKKTIRSRKQRLRISWKLKNNVESR